MDKHYYVDVPPIASPGPYAPMIQEVQEKLHEQGFDAGPVNGQFGTKTQAALAQFQLATVLPVNGALDDATLRALGVTRPSAEERSETADANAESGAR